MIDPLPPATSITSLALPNMLLFSLTPATSRSDILRRPDIAPAGGVSCAQSRRCVVTVATPSAWSFLSPS
eukprot:CAMPEP_0169455120 /NCGR_PEP_ID=MMETSP1042-20121227/15647_1 /TAXON_ID=464988 /ORGANISM="Hemiselmis andersenii, Strain CCMP1180" /LENGTH=69 /DNA_ID=CAMNT_0009567249 /DNA_START=26 /DNA_END=235 /DNA_ORIENTATION=-